VASLLAALRAAGDRDTARALAARVATDSPQASLANPGGTAALLAELRAAGDYAAVRALLDRDPARRARLDGPQDVTRLLAELRAAGDGEAAGILARRAAGAGMFGVFLAYHAGEDTGGAVSYRYGCEPDLTPAPSWRWAPPDPRAAQPGLRRLRRPGVPSDRHARRDQRDSADKIDWALAAEPIEKMEATEATEPIERTDPAEPMHRIEPAEPMDKIDPLDPMLRSEPAEPADRGELCVIPMPGFSHPWPVSGRSGVCLDTFGATMPQDAASRVLARRSLFFEEHLHPVR